MSTLEDGFAKMLGLYGIAGWCEREYVFAKPRRYRFDFAWPELRIAVELEGGIWSNGRHTRGQGYESDCRKYNLAQCLGWVVLRYTRGMVESGEAIRDLQELINSLDRPLVASGTVRKRQKSQGAAMAAGERHNRT